MRAEIHLLVLSCLILPASGALGPRAEPYKLNTAQTQSERFVDNHDDTVTDSQTGLMWAGHDNGSDITWDDAKRYCESYRGGGHSDWRMPTVDELKSLYDRRYSQIALCDNDPKDQLHIIPLIRVSCYGVWSSELEELQGISGARDFDTGAGASSWFRRAGSYFERALPVRSTRK